MTRAIAGLFGGLVAWFLIATVGDLALRIAWTSYAEVEKGQVSALVPFRVSCLSGLDDALGRDVVSARRIHRPGWCGLTAKELKLDDSR